MSKTLTVLGGSVRSCEGGRKPDRRMDDSRSVPLLVYVTPESLYVQDEVRFRVEISPLLPPILPLGRPMDVGPQW